MANDIQKRKKIFEKINKELKKIYPQARIALNFSNPWELLVAAILSAQTTDKKVNEITAKLFKKYKTIDDYAKANLKEFQQDIKGVNYYKNKAKFILENAKIIKEKFGGEVPKTMAELLQLRGVARKTANVVLSIAYNKYEGIVVDTHVKRLTKILGLTNETKPEKIEKDLMEIIPKGPEWRDFPLRLIQYGREYCPAKKHNHQNCPLTKVV
ncbi:MAG: endonuclease III [Candidatus Parcubacteria bacterium]|nr:MAG: endonuclease III [Candidatus Parcubacteria bacterium]